MSRQTVKSLEELLAAGGKFYSLGDDAWCDQGPDSYRFDPGAGGYVLDTGEERLVGDERSPLGRRP